VPNMAFAKRVPSVGEKVTFFVGHLNFDRRSEGSLDLTLGALDEDGAVGDSHLNLVWNQNGLFADPAHNEILDENVLWLRTLPDVAEQLAAGFVATAIRILHQAPRCG